jgi:N-acetylneuraminate synthase
LQEAPVVNDSNQRTRPRLIAEVGCNHAGDIALAEKLISIGANFCEVDAIKFQKRDPRTLLTPEQYDAPHPNADHAYGPTYGAHREFLELSVDQHRHLMKVCADIGVTYSSSVWDMPSARAIVGLEPEFIKIPSATNSNMELLGYLCNEYGGHIHISLGMTTRAEEEALVSFLEARERADSTVLYACTSGYPVPFEDICLGEITRLRDSYGSSVAGIGFSGHHLGIAADIAALALGADWIERHFTLDRTMKGTDHAASLEPDGMRRLARDIRAVFKALGDKDQEILPIEEAQRSKLKWHASS